eukprot:TRINITY_DN9378_c0_g1_i1.p1 TRINITY_DN9378_c0_g1~~TRINITY_DN9378_c0_g1_i1.p1  ORF type:complete len:468 (-),score=115.59 TRINITY_DN9378_c0_g1_i1:125-1528(-)
MIRLVVVTVLALAVTQAVLGVTSTPRPETLSKQINEDLAETQRELNQLRFNKAARGARSVLNNAANAASRAVSAASRTAKNLIGNRLDRAFISLQQGRGCGTDTFSKYSNGVQALFDPAHSKTFKCGTGGKRKCIGEKSQVEAHVPREKQQELDLLLETDEGSEAILVGGARCYNSAAYTLGGISNAIYDDNLRIGSTVPCQACTARGVTSNNYVVEKIWASDGAAGFPPGVIRSGLLRSEDGSSYVLVFRGTDMSTFGRGMSNWGTNLDTRGTRYVTYNGRRQLTGLVHHGFYTAYKALCTNGQMCAYLDQHKQEYQGKTFYVTGHSLGGAMAQAASVDVANMGIAISSVITYGQPRFATRAFVSTYNGIVGRGKMLRFVATFPCYSNFDEAIATDLVTTVPPREFQFQHIGPVCPVACCTPAMSRLGSNPLPQCGELSLRCHMMGGSYNIMHQCSQAQLTRPVTS